MSPQGWWGGGGWDIDWDVRQSVAATIPYNINIMYTLKAF